jgi:hypothetical protein
MPTLSRRPRDYGGLRQLFNWFVRARDYYFALPPLKFEAMTLGLALLFGVLVMPVLIYIPGFYILKPYANGGPFALYWDFYKSLVELRPSSWTALVGPFLFLSLFRIFRLILRKI